MNNLRVKNLLNTYDVSGLIGVKDFLIKNENELNSEFYKDSWLSKIKILMDNKQYISVESEIASILHTFKLLKND